MRVTQKMMVEAARTNLLAQAEKLYNAQNLVSSGKRVTRPSDDPIGMGNILDYRSTLAGIDQFIDNIKNGKIWANLTDETLDVISDFMNTAKAFAQSASANDTIGRAIAAEEVKNARQQIVQLANTRLDDRFIMGGHQTHVPPVSDAGEVHVAQGVPGPLVFELDAAAANVEIQIRDAANTLIRTLVTSGGPGVITELWDGLTDIGDPAPDGLFTFTVNAVDGGGAPVGVAQYPTYNGDDGDHAVIVAKGQTIKANIHGAEAFTITDRVIDPLKALKNLEIELEKAPADFDSSAVDDLIDEIDAGLDQIEEARARGASRLYRMEATLVFNQGFRPKIEQMLADVEDADPTEAIVDLRSQEVAYQAALELTARIFEPTLMDYLR